MNILTTIYILTYKRFDSIFETIESALSQDYSNIELFISDDGSPNFPYQRIIDYIESHKRGNIVSYQVLDNKVNVGTVKHINRILKLASGELFIPLAGDDVFFDKSVVSKIVNRYNQTHFKVLTTSRAKIMDDGEVLSLLPHYASRSVINEKMFTAEQQHREYTECRTREFASGSAMAYEAAFIKQMNYFDEKYRLWEDGPFIAKMTSMGYALALGYDIISIKYRGGGVSSGGNPIIKKDVQLFNTTDRWTNSNEYGLRHRRILKYTVKKFSNSSPILGVFWKVIYLDAFIDQVIYRYREACNAANDTVEINKIRNKR